MVTINENSITVRFRRPREIPNARPRPLPRRNGKLDFVEIQKIARRHADERLARAAVRASTQRRMALSKRYRLRKQLQASMSEYAPLIGTYAEAVEYGQELPPTPPVPRYKPRDFYTPCTCRVCALQAQANKAKENGLKRSAAAAAVRKADSRVNRHWRRRYCLPRQATPQELFLYTDAPEEGAQGVEKPCKASATSQKQTKSSWRRVAQPFDWADFYEGPCEILVEEKKRLRRRIARVASSSEKEVSPVGVRHYLTADAYQRRYAPEGVVSQLNCQMADDEGPLEDKQGNVVLQEAVEPEVEIIGPQLTNLRKYCQGDTVSLPSDMDRWITVKNFTWNVTDKVADDLLGLTLPYDAIWNNISETNDTMKINVMANMARVRQFVQTDMELRVILNSSPFMVGQCQLGWLYTYAEDKYGDLRINPAGVSQMDHVIVDAAEANSGSLVIPYRSYRPYMPIRKRDDMGYPLSLGAVVLTVLNPLVTPGGSSSSVDGVLMCRFTNCVMTGMVPPDLTVMETQMFSSFTAAAAAQWLYQRYADPNRDAPPLPQPPPHVRVTAVGNLANGTNIAENIDSLRLDAKGQTPHPEGVPDEMTVRSIVTKFGWVETIEIPATSASGTSVFCFDAAPVLEKKYYYKQVRDGVNCYTMPPVAVLSQLFAYWRGSVEYRFDFVATRFHQIRLLFAWVPGYTGTPITLSQAQSCAGTYFDLKEGNRSVVVKVPYIADRPWWSHRYSNGVDAEQYKAPGTFCCFVVNRLTYTYAVPSRIWCNVYMRGGEDFELAVPMQPTIGLAYNARFQNSSDVSVQAVPGYFPWYAGTWRNVEGGNAFVMRYGAVSDHVAQFYGLQECTYYKFKDPAIGKTAVLTVGTSSSQIVYTGDVWWLVPVDVNDGYGLAYLGLLNQQKQDQVASYFYKKDGAKWVKRPTTAYDFDLLLDAKMLISSTFYSPASANAELVPTKVPIPTSSDSEDEFVQVQVDNREAVVNSITFETMSLAEASRETFGESFSSLKDLCRRYQPYLASPLTKPDATYGKVDVSFPLLPGGLDLHPLQSPFQNTNREGIIPIVLSGYRFFRGGLRFKLMPNYPDFVVYACQVKPDRALLSCNPRAGGLTMADTLMQHGYATSAQSCHVNPVMVVEVPFYIPGSAGMLCRPTDAALTNAGLNRFFSLGEMCLSFSSIPAVSKQVVDASIIIMYALADDFSAHTFQGFPPMVFIKEAKTG